MAALPALLKTYSVRANVPFQANTSALLMSQSLLFSLKQHMKDTLAGGAVGGTRHANSIWTVLGSSNGTVAALDAVDRWVAHTDLNFAANGAAHSWIVLQNTTLGYQVCLDCNPADGTSMGFAATEIATPFTGGTTLTRPTATNEFCMGNTSTGATATFPFISDQVTGNFNFTHYVTANDGQFFFLTSRTGNGTFTTFMSVQKTINNRVADTRNVFLMGHSTNSGRGAPLDATLAVQALGCTGRNPNGTVNTLGGIQGAARFGASVYATNSGIDAVSGNFVAFPCHVFSLGTQTVYRGELPDLYVIGTAQVGASVPTAAAQARVIAGDYIVPFPTVNPTI